MVERVPGVTVERQSLEGRCPECHAHDLARYEVLSEGGWFVVTKCQKCMTSIERVPWNRLGHVQRADVSEAARARRGGRS